MKYLDSGVRDPAHTLAAWFQSTPVEQIVAFRFQSGFFSVNGIGLLLPFFERSAKENLTVSCLIGANELTTLADDVTFLMEAIGAPRKDCQLGIVSFSQAFFHPKCYHITREDGSQAAYIGSANLTASGLGLHVEAGICLDTNDGDTEEVLQEISRSIDSWFDQNRDGLFIIDDKAIIGQLVDDNVLAAVRPARPPTTNSSKNIKPKKHKKPKLNTLVELPKINHGVAEAADSEAGDAERISEKITYKTVVPHPRFPEYILFAPNAAAPTIGLDGLSGTNLAGSAIGLIIQLNKDSARHFSGGGGTANISIPIATANTIRFGVFGKHSRPRAEFGLTYQYISNDEIFSSESDTNIMGYGYEGLGVSGHKDIRMLVPKDILNLLEFIDHKKHKHPEPGDLALLEWPDPSAKKIGFILSMVAPDTELAAKARALYDQATASRELIGKGACWLPNDFFD